MAGHVSDLNGLPSGAFTSCMLQIWYAVICVLLDTSGCYAVVGIIIKHCVSCWIIYIYRVFHDFRA